MHTPTRPLPESATPLPALARGNLCRAYVSLPLSLCQRERPLQERMVFFEAPLRPGVDPGQFLESLLHFVWHADTQHWGEAGHIYNVTPVYELLSDRRSLGPAGDQRALETGGGGTGPEAIGCDAVHYMNAADIDLFVTPAVAARLQVAMAYVEALRAAEPARRARAVGAAA